MDRPLTPYRVESVFHACLYMEGEDSSNHVLAEGIVHNVGFNPDRIEIHRKDIHDMLAELPNEFKANGGGGWSFLQACIDKDGRQWTGMHRAMEQLFQLGMAIGEVEYLLPRDMWSALPGGMPYLVVKQ